MSKTFNQPTHYLNFLGITKEEDAVYYLNGGKLLKNLPRKIRVFVIFLIILTVPIIGCFQDQKSGKDSKPAIKPYPYGRPITGRLLWENGRQFKDLRVKHGVSQRLAAFQTTLPDPLPGEEYNVRLAAQRLAGTLVRPGEIFSMNSTLGPYSRQRGFRKGPAYHGTEVVDSFGGGVCKVATTLYNVVILSDLPIVERKAHNMLVPYVLPGQDATVGEVQDFKFQNNTDYPLLIWAKTYGNNLIMAFYGKTRNPPK